MRLIATTVVRESIRGRQHTGYIYDVDWDSRTVSTRLPVPDPSFPESDDNPRGGVRGGRGVTVTPQGPVVANYDTILRYDSNWVLEDSFSHPLFVGIHEIDWDGEKLWVTATAVDAVLTVGPGDSVNVVWDPHSPEVASQLRVSGRSHPVDGSVDYRIREAPHVDDCHINCVTRYGDSMVINCGLLLPRASLGARLARRARSAGGRRDGGSARQTGRSAVVRVGADGVTHVLVELDNVDFPNHNGQLLDDGRVVVCDSTRNTLKAFDPDSGAELQNMVVPGTWLRGLEPAGESKLFVGTAPASIVLLDLERNEIADAIALSDDPNEAIHGLTLVGDTGM